jgi:3-phenylpropionate/trans-cinnamate dioxygenase ferredoxin reductase subunit
MTTFVILGGGLAGAKAAEALRGQGFAGDVVLVGTEAHHPYERPPLSKDYLMGKAEEASLHPLSEDWYTENRVDLRLGSTATAIDRKTHEVVLDDGTRLPYDKLLLATGATPRRPAIPGANTALYLRTIEDSDRIRSSFTAGRRLVVIGAGWIGMEVTAAARQAGVEVTVLEAAELPLLRVLGPELGKVFADLHTANGVEFRYGAQVSEITDDGVLLADGTLVPADNVLMAVGVTPNTALAEAAGLEVDNGVVVDAALRSSDPDIFAAGDVANALHPLLGKHIRVEHWANALNQPATAVAAMQGKEASYEEQPYFYTDQYDLGMEYVGHVEPGGYDQVVYRGDVQAREFIAFWLKDGTLLAGMNVNVWDVSEYIKALIGTRVDVDKITDPAVEPADWA